jgi:hypothetical protein
MSQFETYFDIGRAHILHSDGLDHILFIIGLCSLYLMRDWKRVLVLVTAFTIGHSVTLALATLNIISVKQELVEFLIPLTIFISAGSNIFRSTDPSDRSTYINYGYALFFGLIHGLGFSNTLHSLLGKTGNITTQLLAFNLGVEVGQIIIVAVFLIISFILVDLFTLNRRDWKLVLSSAIAGIALLMLYERIYW